jgi:hypothetical protein
MKYMIFSKYRNNNVLNDDGWSSEHTWSSPSGGDFKFPLSNAFISDTIYWTLPLRMFGGRMGNSYTFGIRTNATFEFAKQYSLRFSL